MSTLQGYIFLILKYFANKLCNFIKYRMLFQAVTEYLPSSSFIKIPCKRWKVHCGLTWKQWNLKHSVYQSLNMFRNFEKSLSGRQRYSRKVQTAPVIIRGIWRGLGGYRGWEGACISYLWLSSSKNKFVMVTFCSNALIFLLNVTNIDSFLPYVLPITVACVGIVSAFNVGPGSIFEEPPPSSDILELSAESFISHCPSRGTVESCLTRSVSGLSSLLSLWP